MIKRGILQATFFLVLILTFGLVQTRAQELSLEELADRAATTVGKDPLIIIPGIMGSELIDKENGERVWYSFTKYGVEDLRLPIAVDPRLSVDRLEPGDIIRRIPIRFFPDIDVYGGLIEGLTKRGGYTEADWKDPPMDLRDRLFVFSYDWRRDNVESAKRLIEKIEKLKAQTRNRNTKFSVVAHSMGGLVARYAAMYGKRPLPLRRTRADWRGAKHFSRIFFLGTPNEGSAVALSSLLYGQSSLGGTVRLPFVRYITPVDISTMPSVFQLLPHSRSERFLDENLKPIKVNLYDKKTWEKYGWSIYEDGGAREEFSPMEFRRLERYFGLILARAKRFQIAIDQYTSQPADLKYEFLGGVCRDTLDGIVLKKESNGEWNTMTTANGFKNSRGISYSKGFVKRKMFVPGDGSVTRKSLLAERIGASGKPWSYFIKPGIDKTSVSVLICDDHTRLMNNRAFQSRVLGQLARDAGLLRR